jgi:hypothetical protein
MMVVQCKQKLAHIYTDGHTNHLGTKRRYMVCGTNIGNINIEIIYYILV